MKNYKKIISFIALVAILASTGISSPVSAEGFNDIKKSDWYYNHVTKLITMQITSGYTDGTFRPNSSVTRAEFVTFLCKSTGLVQIDGYTYSDTKNSWAKKWISAAVNNNIIDKVANFNPNKAITRQEAVEMLCRSLNLPEDVSMRSPFADTTANLGYSNTAYKEFLMVGSLKDGKRYFYPNTDLNRSEVAAIIVNLVDYKANSESYKTAKKEELEQKQEQENKEIADYKAWQESVKNIAPELLNNTNGLVKGSVYESNKYLVTESGYLSGWGKDYGMTEEEFAKEIVKVGTDYGNTWANANYKELSKLENSLKSLWETNVINNYLKRNIDYVKNNTLISEGKFLTSTGLIVYTDDGSMTLRGTMKCKYLSPTSINILNADKVGSTGKHLELGVWYEQDFQIRFYPEKKGLKVTAMHSISDIRFSK